MNWSNRRRLRLKQAAGTNSPSKNLKTRFVLAAVCLVVAGLTANDLQAQVQPSGGMIRFPDVSKDKIVFVYANNLWLVSKEGGVATPLANPAGPESFPRFSDDSQTIGFVGNYDGNTDLYTIPAVGGTPVRITYQSASEQLCDWTSDGKLLFSSNGYSGLGRQPQLYAVSEKEPVAVKLPVPYGTNGAISADGNWLAYTPHSRDFRTWKRYRGGMASDIWLFNLTNNTSKRMTDWEGTDSLPMWHGQKVYYVSDQGDEHRLNIWEYDTATGSRKQITAFTEFDCKFPSIGPGSDGEGEIVVQNGASVYLVNLATGDAKAVEILIPGDQPQLRPQQVDASEFINGADISPSAKRIAVEARGDIWTAPVKNGSPRNLTRSSGAAERSPSWSPNGQWVAYFSDLSGEYELYVTQSDGQGETKRLTNDGEVFRYNPSWSPDSKKIVFADKTGALYLYSFESEEVTKLDHDPYGQQLSVNWSHSSQWITYAKTADTKAPSTSIWVCDVISGERHQLTSGFFGDSSPTFDRKGDYIYFSSNRAFSNPKYEDLGTTWVYSGTEVLIAMPLRADVENPLLPSSDEETWEEEADDSDAEKGDAKDGDAADGDAKDGDAKDGDADEEGSPSDKSSDEAKEEADDEAAEDDKDEDKVEPIVIEKEGIERRSFQLPASSGNFMGLTTNDKGHLIYTRMPARGISSPPSIKILDLSADSPAEKSVVDGAAAFTLTPKGDKMLVLRGSTGFVVAAMPGQKLTEPVSTDGMIVEIDPRAEWKQIFADAWRFQRDFFYDPTMHGVDWQAVRARYEPMLEDCVTRRDVGFVIGEMISELNVGHAYYRPGSEENGERVSIGTLACRFELNDGAFQLAELYEGAVWDVDARNPLRMAGVKEGEYLLGVNGVAMDTTKDPYASFQGIAGQTVTLQVSDKATGGEEREVVVRLLSSDSPHRYRAWIERNRKYVDEQSGGKVGYIYVPNTGINGQDDLVRQFYGQLDKEALIIDDRWNGGGQIPTRFIELLNRPVTNYWARRDGRDWTWPPDSHQGPKCMLINGLAGSGGDMFPALFKQAGLGKLIGMRTWGGLVGITGGPQLVDGASVTEPSFAYYEKDGTWGIEGHGVDPDIEVIDDPALMVDGGDPQLDAAIAHMMEQIKLNPYQAPERPAYPDRSKFGIEDSDK